MKCDVRTFTAPTATEIVEVVQGILTSDQPPCPDDPPDDPPTPEPEPIGCDVLAYTIFHYSLNCVTKQWDISVLNTGCMEQQLWGGTPDGCNTFYGLDVDQSVFDQYPLWLRNQVNSSPSDYFNPDTTDGYMIKWVKGYLCTVQGYADVENQIPICYPNIIVDSGTMGTPISDVGSIELGDFGYPEHTPLAYNNNNMNPSFQPDGTIDHYLAYIGWTNNQNLIYGETNTVNFGPQNPAVYIGYNNTTDPPNEPKIGLITESCYLDYVWIVMYVEVGGVVKYSIQSCSFETFPTDTTQQTEWVSYGNKPNAFNNTFTGCPIEDEVCYTWSSNQYCYTQMIDNITYSEPVQIYRKTKKVPIRSIKDMTFLQLRKSFFGDAPRGTYSTTTAVATASGIVHSNNLLGQIILGVAYDLEPTYFENKCGDNSSSILFRKSRGKNFNLNAYINITSANAPNIIQPFGGTQLGFKKLTSFETTNNLKKYHLRNIEVNKYSLYNNTGRQYEHRFYNANTGGFTLIFDNGNVHITQILPTDGTPLHNHRRPIGRTARKSAPELGTRKDFTFIIDGHTYNEDNTSVKAFVTVTINQL